MLNTRIRSIGSYLPKRIVTNKDLEAMMNTTDEWIQQRSGIKERRWSNTEETTLYMATQASQQALEKAGLGIDDIDAILFTSLLSDYQFPGSGCLLQNSLGGTRTIPAMDIRNACTGFLYALSVANAWIRSGTYNKVLICGSELHSTSVQQNPSGRDTGVLFGDAATAVILEASEKDASSIVDLTLASQGQYADALSLKKPSPNDHPRVPENFPNTAEWFPRMDGRLVFKHAVERMIESVTNLVKKNDLSISDIDFVIAHQANKRIIQAVLQNLNIPDEKTHYTLDRFGNTTSCTIPLTINEAVEQGKIKRGDLVCCTAFGAGFTWGTTLIRY